MIPLKDINPTERFAVVTFSLIVLNIAIFLFQLALGEGAGERFISTFALVPQHLISGTHSQGDSIPPLATVFSSMFLHGGLLHLAGNMLYLWIFGNNVEDAMGRFRFLIFYLVCGVMAGYCHAYINSSSIVPMIGASGAVSGVLGAYLLLYPRARVVTLFFLGFYIRTIPVPAMAVLLFWFVLQFVNAFLSTSTGAGVAWFAHVGGFIAGLVLIGPFKRPSVPFGGAGGMQNL